LSDDNQRFFQGDLAILCVRVCTAVGKEEERGQVEQKRQMKQSLEMYIQGVKR